MPTFYLIIQQQLIDSNSFAVP